jgi:protein O-GlcNAc transferase
MFDATAVEYRKAIDLKPNFALAYNNYGDLLRRQNKYAEAKAEIDKALAIDKKSAVAHMTLGEVFRDTGRRDEAIVEIKEALRLRPEYPLARRELDKLIPPLPGAGTVQQK